MEILTGKIYALNEIKSFDSQICNNTEISEDAARDMQIRAKSQEMEALFITEMFKAMEKTVPEDATGGSNNLPKMMFSSVMGDAVAKNGGIGLAHTIYSALKEKDQALNFEALRDNGILTGLDAIPVLPTMESE